MASALEKTASFKCCLLSLSKVQKSRTSHTSYVSGQVATHMKETWKRTLCLLISILWGRAMSCVRLDAEYSNSTREQNLLIRSSSHILLCSVIGICYGNKDYDLYF